MSKSTKPVDLFEYAEERVPFDVVIRKIGKVAPVHEPKPKTPKKPRKRK